MGSEAMDIRDTTRSPERMRMALQLIRDLVEVTQDELSRAYSLRLDPFFLAQIARYGLEDIDAIGLSDPDKEAC